jgi:hypothetical protein
MTGGDMSEPTTCAICHLALFSPAACYGDIHGATFCLCCWLETVDMLKRAEYLDRATDILVDKQIERELCEDLWEEHAGLVDELSRRLPARPVRRAIGPMLPLVGVTDA